MYFFNNTIVYVIFHHFARYGKMFSIISLATGAAI